MTSSVGSPDAVRCLQLVWRLVGDGNMEGLEAAGTGGLQWRSLSRGSGDCTLGRRRRQKLARLLTSPCERSCSSIFLLSSRLERSCLFCCFRLLGVDHSSLLAPNGTGACQYEPLLSVVQSESTF